jgi:hypothetical protein
MEPGGGTKLDRLGCGEESNEQAAAYIATGTSNCLDQARVIAIPVPAP